MGGPTGLRASPYDLSGGLNAVQERPERAIKPAPAGCR